MGKSRDSEELSEMFTQLKSKRMDLSGRTEQINRLQDQLNVLLKQAEPIKREVANLLQEIGWRAKVMGLHFGEKHQIPRLFIPFHVVEKIRAQVAHKITISFDFNPLMEDDLVRDVLVKLGYQVQTREGALDLEYECPFPTYRDFSDQELTMLKNVVLAELPRFEQSLRSHNE